MDAFHALSDPNRRRIVELLGSGERAVGEIGEQFSISPPAVSQHLKVLRDSGLVRVRVEGQRRIYSLDPAGLDELDRWIARVRRFWAPRLDALERQLEISDGDD